MGQEVERFRQWWSKDTVAVVTGANKGIGLAIVRQLAKQGITVVLTARDANRAEQALESLKSEGLDDRVVFHTLDVNREQSAQELAEWLRQTYGGIDILINNAATSSNEMGANFEDAISIMNTNYFGVKNVTKALLPLARNTPGGARIVVVSSRAGVLKNLGNKNQLKTTLSDREHITEDLVDRSVAACLAETENGTWKEEDWADMRKVGYAYPYRSYAVSKMAVNAYVSVLHNNTRLAAAGGKSKLINVFSCCPGHVDTDLSGHLGPRTVDQGADTPVWLALQSPKGGSGKFWADRTEIEF